MSDTKATFANFWHYNKFKIIIVAALIAFVAFALSQCSFGTEVDLGILHVSEVSGVDGTAFVDMLQNEIELLSEADIPNIEFVSVYVPTDPRFVAETGALEKIQLELARGNSTLFVLDEETLYSYAGEELFHDLTTLADSYGIAEADRYIGQNGETIAISVDGNTCLEKCSLENKSLYLAMRAHDEDDASKYHNAYEVAEYIIKEK